MRKAGDAYRLLAEPMQKGFVYILGGAFMVVVGTLANIAFGTHSAFFGTPLWFLGLLVIGYGVWLRR